MLYQDYNSTIRDIFRQVEGVSQHGLEELYDKDIEEGIRSYSDALIAAGMVSKEDLINLVSQFLGYELQVGEVEEIDAETIQSISSETAHQYAVVPLYLSSGGIHLLASDPFNSGIIDDLTFALNQEIHLVVCDPDEVTRLWKSTIRNRKVPWMTSSAEMVSINLKVWMKIRRGTWQMRRMKLRLFDL